MTKERNSSGDNPLFTSQTFNWLRQRNEASKEPIPEPTLFDTAHDAIQEKLAPSPTTLYVSPEWQGERNGYEGTYGANGPTVRATVTRDGLAVSITQISAAALDGNLAIGVPLLEKSERTEREYKVAVRLEPNGECKVKMQERKVELTGIWSPQHAPWEDTEVPEELEEEYFLEMIIQRLHSEAKSQGQDLSAPEVSQQYFKKHGNRGGKPRNPGPHRKGRKK